MDRKATAHVSQQMLHKCATAAPYHYGPLCSFKVRQNGLGDVREITTAIKFTKKKQTTEQTKKAHMDKQQFRN